MYANQKNMYLTGLLLKKRARFRHQHLYARQEGLRPILKGMKKGNIIHLHLECKGKLVGVVDAERGEYKHHGNVFLGITILPPFRSKGLGEFALRELIARAKSEMKPKNIYLTVYTDNKKAIRLYRKLGFVRHHVLKNWINHYGRYLDEEFYILKR